MHNDECFNQSVSIIYFSTEEFQLSPSAEIMHVPVPGTEVDMDIVSPQIEQALPFYCPLLLVSYRILAYFTWNRTFSHIRQRLLEAVAGGLHSSAPSI
ncbi:MAG: hypothetical protein OIF58_05650, partial [Cohaesibacter sp.]|nr:hypothetical protein [Cohaesibacter sp.]